jgi:hypothetical protein
VHYFGHYTVSFQRSLQQKILKKKTSGKYSWYSSLLEVSRTQVLSATGRIMPIKNSNEPTTFLPVAQFLIQLHKCVRHIDVLTGFNNVVSLQVQLLFHLLRAAACRSKEPPVLKQELPPHASRAFVPYSAFCFTSLLAL